MPLIDRDYSKEKMREIDPREEKKYNKLLYLAIAVAIVSIIFVWLIR